MLKYTLPELAHDHSALEPHYSARLLELHHGKHHAAYATGANEIAEPVRKHRREAVAPSQRETKSEATEGTWAPSPASTRCSIPRS